MNRKVQQFLSFVVALCMVIGLAPMLTPAARADDDDVSIEMEDEIIESSEDEVTDESDDADDGEDVWLEDGDETEEEESDSDDDGEDIWFDDGVETEEDDSDSADESDDSSDEEAAEDEEPADKEENSSDASEEENPDSEDVDETEEDDSDSADESDESSDEEVAEDEESDEEEDSSDVSDDEEEDGEDWDEDDSDGDDWDEDDSDGDDWDEDDSDGDDWDEDDSDGDDYDEDDEDAWDYDEDEEVVDKTPIKNESTGSTGTSIPAQNGQKVPSVGENYAYVHSKADFLEKLAADEVRAVYLTCSVTLDENLTLKNKRIEICEGGVLTVPKGVTLKNGATIVLNGGSLQVEGKYRDFVSGKDGKAYVGSLNLIQNKYADLSKATNLSAALITVERYVTDFAQLKYILSTVGEQYGRLELYIGNYVTITEDMTIPEHVLITCYIANDWTEVALVIPENVTVVNKGEIDIQTGAKLNVKGKLKNSGFVGTYNEGTVEGKKKISGNAWNTFDDLKTVRPTTAKKVTKAITAGEASTIVAPVTEAKTLEQFNMDYVWVRVPKDAESLYRAGWKLSGRNEKAESVTYIACPVKIYK